MILLLSVRLLDDRFHGLTANGERPEWPPSPFRLFQAIVAGNARGETIPPEVVEALQWLETLDPPEIIVPSTHTGRVLLTYVLNNTEGRSRTQKFIRPTLLNGDRLIEFAWGYDPKDTKSQGHPETLTRAVRHVRAFGWGIDLAIGHGEVIASLPKHSDSRLRFSPAEDADAIGPDIRSPRPGSLASLRDCYAQYIGRFESNESTVLESGGPIYQLHAYTTEQPRPHAVFKLLDENNKLIRYPHAKLIHIAGMVRHLAKLMMTANPPRELRGRTAAEWVESYVMGHPRKKDGKPTEANKCVDPMFPPDSDIHTQFSYVPLQSIGTEHTDPGVRRVMIVAPFGDDVWLEHLAARLDGEPLKPLPNTTLPDGTRLERIPDNTKDGVRDAYLKLSRTWASVTPVILDKHVKQVNRKDKRTGEMRKVWNHDELICEALKRAGIEQPCEFEWSAFSHFRQMLSAHKYRRDPEQPEKKIQHNYIRPDHLLDKSCVHVVIRFGRREDPNDENSRWIPANVLVPGPITLGAGRHCGFGLMAAIDA